MIALNCSRPAHSDSTVTAGLRSDHPLQTLPMEAEEHACYACCAAAAAGWPMAGATLACCQLFEYGPFCQLLQNQFTCCACCVAAADNRRGGGPPSNAASGGAAASMRLLGFLDRSSAAASLPSGVGSATIRARHRSCFHDNPNSKSWKRL